MSTHSVFDSTVWIGTRLCDALFVVRVLSRSDCGVDGELLQ